jgi:subtilase family serine protease
MQAAYGFNNSNISSLTGTGTTIAIVDAYDDPTIAADLQAFDKQFALANPHFVKENENGGTSMPAASSNWAPEIALDVEWAHAIAPGASILLVEANSASFNDLLTAVNTARNTAGVVVVSMSWGGGEFSGETAYDSYFTTPTGHNPETFVASSGDSGAPASYPAASPNVLSVGGTSLTLSGSTYVSETAWSGSGGGLSSVETQPSYQKGVVTQSSTQRATPDVAYDADPNTGVPVYDTTGSGGWAQYGGTSIAAPQWAALIALADQARAANGLTSLNGRSQTLPMLYSMPATDFHDITTGSSTGSPKLSAGPGYDLVTGRGTPIANLLIPALAGGTIAPSATHFSVATSTTSGTAGQSFSVTVTALDGNNNVFTSYAGAVQLTSSDGKAILPAAHTLTNGVYTFTGVVLDTAGSDTITATDTNNAALTGSAQETVMPAAASTLAFVQQPTTTVAGTAISPAVSVGLFDAYGNLLTGDNSDTVTIGLGANTTGAALSGTKTVTASGGIASFSNLSINNVGSYTLQVTSTTAAVTASLPASNSFNVVALQPATVIESFESRSLSNYYYVGPSRPTVTVTTAAAHDGSYGLSTGPNNDWYFRDDSAAQINHGDTVSVWMKFATTASGRAYFGFGAGPNGTLSLVAAPNTGQLILQDNSGWNYTQLAAVNQTWQTNQWYRLEVDWGTSGKIVAKLYDSTGANLLNTVTAADMAITAGGFAFRTTGSTTYWDTVTDARSVNTFAVPAASASSLPSTGSTAVAMLPPSFGSSFGLPSTSGMSASELLFSDLQFLETLGYFGLGS